MSHHGTQEVASGGLGALKLALTEDGSAFPHGINGVTYPVALPRTFDLVGEVLRKIGYESD